MALIKCKECGKEISDQATSCPNCGVKTEIVKYKKKKLFTIFKIMIVLGVIFSFIYFIYSNSPVNKYKSNVISLLNEYKQNKYSMTINDLYEQIDKLQNNFEKEYKDNIERDTSYSDLSIILSFLSHDLYIDSRNNDVLSDFQIEEYIKEIHRY